MQLCRKKVVILHLGFIANINNKSKIDKNEQRHNHRIRPYCTGPHRI